MIKRPPEPRLARARQLRRDMTTAEAILWRVLRDRGIGVKFRRQVPIGPYIADFVCIERWLIIELDGAMHDKTTRQIYDNDRDEWLRQQGWRVVRFSNEVVIGGADLVVARIKEIVGG